jgi:hypothetical protein
MLIRFSAAIAAMTLLSSPALAEGIKLTDPADRAYRPYRRRYRRRGRQAGPVQSQQQGGQGVCGKHGA